MTKGERIIHKVRGQLNAIAMNAELGKMYIQQGKTAEHLQSPVDKIVQQCAACASVLDSLYDYLAELERDQPRSTSQEH